MPAQVLGSSAPTAAMMVEVKLALAGQLPEEAMSHVQIPLPPHDPVLGATQQLSSAAGFD
jgi:hypothetical protein